MVLAHLYNGADISVATMPVPLEQATAFGIVDLDAEHRVRAFHEKPAHPQPMPDRPGHACVSMGNYLFDPDVLKTLLDAAASRGETDFGHHVLPRAISSHRVFAYDFSDNRVTGTLPNEEPHYWRDVGTVAAYRAAQQDALGRAPKFNLDNALWPIGGRSPSHQAGAAR
jgi:glucose-1-phosphate adenylyltransferase